MVIKMVFKQSSESAKAEQKELRNSVASMYYYSIGPDHVIYTILNTYIL